MKAQVVIIENEVVPRSPYRNMYKANDPRAPIQTPTWHPTSLVFHGDQIIQVDVEIAELVAAMLDFGLVPRNSCQDWGMTGNVWLILENNDVTEAFCKLVSCTSVTPSTHPQFSGCVAIEFPREAILEVLAKVRTLAN